MPAAFLQGRHRQQFVPSQQIVALAEARSAVTWGCVLCHHTLIVQGGRKPAAFGAGWGTILVPGQDMRDGNLCCKTAQVINETKFAETRVRQSLCCPQSWDAHPANQIKCFMREWERPALVHCYSFPWLAQAGCTESVTRYPWCKAFSVLKSSRLKTPGSGKIVCSLFLPCNALSVCSEQMVQVCNWMGQGSLGEGMVKQILLPVTK